MESSVIIPNQPKTKKPKNATIESFYRKRPRQETEGSPSSNPPSSEHHSSPSVNTTNDESQGRTNSTPYNVTPNVERVNEFDLLSLPRDPALRKRMCDYHPNDRDIVTRVYIRLGPYQLKEYDFPYKHIGLKQRRRFNPKWLDSDYKSWLEYSIEKDAAFCFPCYLFRGEVVVGGDAFIIDGFSTWSKTDSFVNISMLLSYSIGSSYKSRKISFATKLSFRGHDEKWTSSNWGNYIEVLKLIASCDKEATKVMLENAPENCILTSSKIQNDTISDCARETTMRIIKELDGGLFAILADESADISDKEQMALCLRYVDKLGKVQERLLGVVHVGNTTSLTLKMAIDSLFEKFGLTLCGVRGQGYDGASNMRGEISGLKTLMLQECESAYYVHCFAHQLQLTLVAVANKNDDCGWLFGVLTTMVNVVGGSCKRREILREKQAERVMEGIKLGEIETGTGLNQELGLCWPCDTRWSSHFKTILHMLALYWSILDVIHTIAESSEGMSKASVESLAFNMKLFDFVFAAHLMVSVFGITYQLNMALQKKEQDIVNVTKERLQVLRDDG